MQHATTSINTCIKETKKHIFNVLKKKNIFNYQITLMTN